MCRIKNRYIVISFVSIILLLLLPICCNANHSFETLQFVGKVNTNILNVRQGPGTQFDICAKINRDDEVNVYGQIGQWYLVQTSNNTFGLCNSKYIENIGNFSNENNILNIINEQRTNKKVKNLTMDEKLVEIAKIKAQDIIDNQYFSHISEKLGTPFEMLNAYDVKFVTVGENIAKGNSIDEIIDVITQSNSYKNNYLSNDYNYTGIAIVPIDEYEYLYVQLFVGR